MNKVRSRKISGNIFCICEKDTWKHDIMMPKVSIILSIYLNRKEIASEKSGARDIHARKLRRKLNC